MNDQVPVKLLVTSREAAKMLSISERTLFSLAACGQVKRLKIFSSVRFDVKDLVAFIEAKKKGGAV